MGPGCCDDVRIPTSRSRVIAKIGGIFLALLVVLAAARLVSYNIWSCIGDLNAAAFGFFVYRRFFKSEVEFNPACLHCESNEMLLVFALMVFLDMALAVGTFVQLLTKAPAIEAGANSVILKPWQTDFGLACSAAGLVIYCALMTVSIILWQELRRNAHRIDVYGDNAHAPFGGYGGGGFRGPTRQDSYGTAYGGAGNSTGTRVSADGNVHTLGGSGGGPVQRPSAAPTPVSDPSAARTASSAERAAEERARRVAAAEKRMGVEHMA